MKLVVQTFVLFAALAIFPSFLFGQVKSITREAFEAALVEAEAKTDKQVRKRVQIKKLYTYGEVRNTLTDTSEYLTPDKWRTVSVENGRDGVKRFESIRVGNYSYTKMNNGKWVKQIYGQGDRFLIGSGAGDSASEYFTEEATVGDEKFQVLTRKTVYPRTDSFREEKIWINANGLIHKRASTASFMKPENITSTVDVAYDYNIKPPKIVAPVK